MASSSWLQGLVRGVFIEVLWDVNNVFVEGRRKGETTTESVWWRGEITQLKLEDGHMIAKLKYDAMGSFKSQVDDVRVLPLHIQLLNDREMTQLRWRFYQLSGNVTYDKEGAGYFSNGTATSLEGVEGNGFDGSQHIAIYRTLEELRHRVDQVEKFMVTYREVAERVSSSSSSSERQCERLFMLMRQKLALVTQKPLAGFRARADPSEKSTVFDRSCADSLRCHVDCTAEEFEMICVAVRAKAPRAYFRVDRSAFEPGSGSLNASFDVAEILFESLPELCCAIGVTSEADILTIAQCEAFPHRKSTSLDDAALRICGSFLADADSEETPAAMLICRTLHEGVDLQKKVSVLWRQKRDLDSRTVWYRHQLVQEEMSVSTMLHDLYVKKNKGGPSSGCMQDTLGVLSRESNCFAVRFKPSPCPKGRMWTRSMIARTNSIGTCEVEVPYVLLRGGKAVKEITSLIDDDYLKHVLGSA